MPRRTALIVTKHKTKLMTSAAKHVLD